MTAHASFALGSAIVTLVLASMGCGGAEPAAAASPAPAGDVVARGEVPAASGKGARVTASKPGATCEGAKNAWADSVVASGAHPPEPPAGFDDELKAVLNRGHYLNECNVAPSADVAICAAVIDGEARGVSVEIDGGDQPQADCVVDAVGKLPFPKHETMTVAKTHFAPTK